MKWIHNIHVLVAKQYQTQTLAQQAWLVIHPKSPNPKLQEFLGHQKLMAKNLMSIKAT